MTSERETKEIIGQIVKERIDNFPTANNIYKDKDVAESIKDKFGIKNTKDSCRVFYQEVCFTEIDKEYVFRMHIVDETKCIEAFITSIDDNGNSIELLGSSNDEDIIFTSTTNETKVVIVMWYDSVDETKIGVNQIASKLSNIETPKPTFVHSLSLTPTQLEQAKVSKFSDEYKRLSKVNRKFDADYDGDSKVNGFSKLNSTKPKNKRLKNKAARASRKRNR